MPIYAYECENCGAAFDAFASIPKKESGWRPQCPQCGSTQTRHIFKVVPLIARSPGASSKGGCCSSR